MEERGERRIEVKRKWRAIRDTLRNFFLSPSTEMLSFFQQHDLTTSGTERTEPSSDSLTTKCLTSRPQFRKSWVG
jgi:hypothetical protein